MPTKKKQLTEKQAIQVMTRRRNCIQKYRKSYKNKTISFSNPVVSSIKEIPREPVKKKRTNKKKEPVVEATEVVPVPVVEAVPEKKKRVYKKKESVIEEPEPVVE